MIGFICIATSRLNMFENMVVEWSFLLQTQHPVNLNFLAEDKNMIQDKVRILSADASCLKEDLTVEIVELLPVEDIRLNNEDQATTECSSSFGYSQSEDEGQSCEVESELREGNGAMPSAEDVPTIGQTSDFAIVVTRFP